MILIVECTNSEVYASNHAKNDKMTAATKLKLSIILVAEATHEAVW